MLLVMYWKLWMITVFKLLFDISLAIIGFIILSPIFIIFSIIIYLQDLHNPFYIAPRVGKDRKLYKMIKFRSMIINADRTGVDSTSDKDVRITGVGRFIRKYKIDELPNLINIIKGDMSFVGPRPNVNRETNLYTKLEKELLSVRPGITDFASIVFADEGEILEGSEDPDLTYNQLIRPWKSRMGLLYIKHRTFWMDVKLIFITILSIVSKPLALKRVYSILSDISASDNLLKVSLRENKLVPTPPPGSSIIITSRF